LILFTFKDPVTFQNVVDCCHQQLWRQQSRQQQS
jgi:hypothetical protein